MSVLESGLWPSHDVDGCPVVGELAALAGKPLAAAELDHIWCGILLFMKGGLDCMANDVGLPHWSTWYLCGKCWADRDGCNYKDFRARSGWRRTVHSAEAFAARFRDTALHPLLTHACVVMSHHFWALDTLHVMDYNGVSCNVLGSVCCDIIRDNEFATTSADSLARLNADLAQYYEQTGIGDRLELTMPMLHCEKLDDFPVLGGPGMKGAAVKAMVPWAARLRCERFVGLEPFVAWADFDLKLTIPNQLR